MEPAITKVLIETIQTMILSIIKALLTIREWTSLSYERENRCRPDPCDIRCLPVGIWLLDRASMNWDRVLHDANCHP
jgi:hypothetical protein